MSPRVRIAISTLALAALIASLTLIITGCGPGAPRTASITYSGQTGSVQFMGSSSRQSARAQAVTTPALPASGPVDELWVIARPDGLQQAEPPEQAEEEIPGSGALVTRLPDREQRVPVPLEHTEVSARVSAYVASVHVTQKFHNPFDSKIEAVYVFPLPQDAGVNEFIMTLGDRKIRGIIREKEEAEEIYDQARSRGHVASLLTQQRPNVFTQKVANIEPGKGIDIDITYFHPLRYTDGWYEFVFPMVVGPRFNPPGSTDGIGAVGRGHRAASGQGTEVQYLKPRERSGHDIGLTLEIDAGVTIEELESVHHKVVHKAIDPMRARVSLDSSDTLPNKDFVLRYRVAGETLKTNVLTHRDERGGYFSMVLYPPREMKRIPRSPMEMVFVLDCSGSMSGKPIEQAKDAIIHGIRQLESGDTFQVIRFSSDASQLGSRPLPATQRNKRKAIRYVRKLQGGGGTMMIEGIKAALDFPHSEDRLRFVCFMTDGYIGNDRQIIGEVHDRLGPARVFSFGVGSSPNRYLMNRMAKTGRGAAAYLSLEQDGEDVMDDFFRRVSHPTLRDIELSFGDARVHDVYPRRIPDLHVGRPVVITGRFRGALDQAIRITGRSGDRTLNVLLPIDDHGEVETHPALPAIWARTRIADLYDRLQWDADEQLVDAIRETALDYELMSEFTSFVAVDSLTRTAGDTGTTVNFPVPTPEGVKYETTVQEN